MPPWALRRAPWDIKIFEREGIIMLDVNRTFTPSEAAVASGVPLKIVNQEIDQGPLKAARKESGSKRSLKEDDIFYLVIANRLDTRLLQLTAEGKDRVNAAIDVVPVEDGSRFVT